MALPAETPTSLSALTDGAVIGMFLNGIGALFAVAGGVMIVVTVIRALWPNQSGAAAAQGNRAEVRS